MYPPTINSIYYNRNAENPFGYLTPVKIKINDSYRGNYAQI